MRAWDQVDGALKWQLNVKSSQAAKAALDGTVGKSAAAGAIPTANSAAKPAMAVKLEEGGNTATEVAVLSHGELKVCDTETFLKI